MSFIQITNAFGYYGVDVVLLAALTSLTVNILKKTILKKCSKKLFTFLPFVFGIIFFAAYSALAHLSFRYITENIADILEHGFSVGALSSLLYVWYAQFVKNKSTQTAAQGVISALICGYVVSEKCDEAAEKIAKAVEEDDTDDKEKETEEILLTYAEEGVSESDVKTLAQLIIKTLACLTVES